MRTQTKYLVTLLVAIVYYIANPPAVYYNAVCFGLILLFGIPHGAADHRIHTSIHKDANLRKYILKYILIAAGYVLWWLFMPGKAFIIFLLISAYHFGQEFLEHVNITPTKAWESMIWGCVILMVPLLLTYSNIKPILEDISNATLPDSTTFTRIILVSGIIACSLAHVAYLHTKNQINRLQMRGQIEMIVWVVVLYTLLPFLVAFTLYFILFHSLNAFHHQFTWLKSRIKSYTIKSFLRDLSMFSLLSVFGLVFFVFILQPENWTELTSYFFIVISVLTLPHTLLFDRFYESRRAL